MFEVLEFTVAKRNNLKSSWTYYHGWGKSKKTKLRFSKSGDEYIETAYATHYISQRTLDEIKAKKDTSTQDSDM